MTGVMGIIILNINISMRINFLALALTFTLIGCNKEGSTTSTSSSKKDIIANDVKTQEVVYNVGGVDYKSFVAYAEDQSAPRPVVLVLPEWWGLNEYAKSRAKQLAGLGYFAMAVDFYGNAKVVNTLEEAQKLSAPLYKTKVNTKLLFDAAKAQLLKFDQADYSKIAVIGYCFGGAQALNMARQERDLKGVVSFHGNLQTGVRAKNNVVKYLVLNGADDTFVPQKEREAFKKEMDSAKINYQFVDYPGAIHSFSNPEATDIGKKFNLKVAYNKEADMKSWQAMKDFLAKVFKS